MKKLDVVHHFDVAKFGADWAYTMDGSQIGELEYENFNAAGAKVTFKEKRTSWLCQRKMINSMLIANDFKMNYLGETQKKPKDMKVSFMYT
jgi:tripeptide aminopeptidase